MVLAASVSWFPKAIHLAVVDPGVGSNRRAVILSTYDGSLLVGPDNGLLMPSAAQLGGVEGAWEITNPLLGLSGRSSTFHGRDVFAPAAAHLARGVPPAEFGPAVEVASLAELPGAVLEDRGDHIRAEIVRVDRFGNLQTNVSGEFLERLALTPGAEVEVGVSGKVLTARFRRSYAFGERGELQLVEDSHGCLALCVNQGNAAGSIPGAGPGSEVLLSKP
jgi:S-adenosylmethionine hydrolase